MTPLDFESCVNELVSATGHHYLHSSPETLARFEAARAIVMALLKAAA